MLQKRTIIIRAVYSSRSVWGSDQTVTVFCADNTTLEAAVAIANDLIKTQPSTHRMAFVLKSVTVSEETRMIDGAGE